MSSVFPVGISIPYNQVAISGAWLIWPAKLICFPILRLGFNSTYPLARSSYCFCDLRVCHLWPPLGKLKDFKTPATKGKDAALVAAIFPSPQTIGGIGAKELSTTQTPASFQIPLDPPAALRSPHGSLLNSATMQVVFTVSQHA